MSNTFTVWITKYALTSGIEKAQAKETSTPSMIEKCNGGLQPYFHGEGRDWHRTRESAIARAKAMRAAKIKTLTASIRKLEKMTFNPEA